MLNSCIRLGFYPEVHIICFRIYNMVWLKSPTLLLRPFSTTLKFYKNTVFPMVQYKAEESHLFLQIFIFFRIFYLVQGWRVQPFSPTSIRLTRPWHRQEEHEHQDIKIAHSKWEILLIFSQKKVSNNIWNSGVLNFRMCYP